ncbi:hypothetical protein M3582_18600 [Priestia megaterium]|uniref:hypothetical protein n=1 Tax=Priestia megaterium TaxID=1404 RepID=UPI00119D29DA|nr:hypothetical protein [Priestia megaterium]MCM3020093.1 hypothetical protein [Priestia megaterium]
MIDDTGKQITRYTGKTFNGLEEIIRYILNNIQKNLHNQNLESERFVDLLKAYFTVCYCQTCFSDNYISDRTRYLVRRKAMEEIMIWRYELEEMFREFDIEEIEELELLFNENQPITLGDLIRFKYRLLPESFLNFIGVEESEYYELKDNELGNLIIEKLKDEHFSNRAKTFFSINF